MVRLKVLVWRLGKLFYLSRGEIRGLILLFPLCILSMFTPWLYRLYLIDHVQNNGSMDHLDSLYHYLEIKTSIAEKAQSEQINALDFNPNTVNYSELVQFGVDSTLAGRIINYRNKGGKFRVKTDLLKIYGLDSSIYSRLKSHIKIPQKRYAKRDRSYSKPVIQYQKKDINRADTSDLKRVYGIGSVLSRRIIKFRDRLGGFVNKEQLGEVYGLQDSVIQKIWKRFTFDSLNSPRQININTADFEQLRAHPYIRYSQAKKILNYREMHGNFESIERLKDIHTLNDSIFQKLKPYITN